MKTRYRLMRHEGHARWELSEKPGWKVVFHNLELAVVLDHVESAGIDVNDVTLIIQGGTNQTLAEFKADQEKMERRFLAED